MVLVKSEDFVIEVRLWDDNKRCYWRLFAIYASTYEKKNGMTNGYA